MYIYYTTVLTPTTLLLYYSTTLLLYYSILPYDYTPILLYSYPTLRLSDSTTASPGTMQHKIYITPAEFGWCVDIHQDTIVVGSPSAGYQHEQHGTTNDDTSTKRNPDLNLNQNVRKTGTGAVYVFTFRDTAALPVTSAVAAGFELKWREHEILHAPDRSHTDRFGESLSLDTDVVVVGDTLLLWCVGGVVCWWLLLWCVFLVVCLLSLLVCGICRAILTLPPHFYPTHEPRMNHT